MPLLILFIYQQGYEVTIGDVWAFNFWPMINLILSVFPKKWAKKVKARMHSRRSFHYLKCAIDLNLFKDGKYLRGTKAHEPFGIFWESLDPDATWGGRFKKRDGSHYSLGES